MHSTAAGSTLKLTMTDDKIIIPTTEELESQRHLHLNRYNAEVTVETNLFLARDKHLKDISALTKIARDNFIRWMLISFLNTAEPTNTIGDIQKFLDFINRAYAEIFQEFLNMLQTIESTPWIGEENWKRLTVFLAVYDEAIDYFERNPQTLNKYFETKPQKPSGIEYFGNLFQNIIEIQKLKDSLARIKKQIKEYNRSTADSLSMLTSTGLVVSAMKHNDSDLTDAVRKYQHVKQLTSPANRTYTPKTQGTSIPAALPMQRATTCPPTSDLQSNTSFRTATSIPAAPPSTPAISTRSLKARTISK